MKLLLTLVVATLACAGPARPGPTTDLLFVEGIFIDLPDGQAISYDHQRTGAESPDFVPITDGRITLLTGPTANSAGERSLSLTVEASVMRREIVDFPVSGGNPVLMVLLESAVRSMATISGGSPFYIRNRIKDSLRTGGEATSGSRDFGGRTIAVQEVTLRPFAQDPNRARMGAFADLTLRFVVSDAVPGHFLMLSADTPDQAKGYHENITLTPQEAAE